jgi:hypothetical protein
MYIEGPSECESDSEDENNIQGLINEGNIPSDDHSVTLIGNNRMQQRVEEVVVNDKTTIHKIKLRNRLDMSQHD